MPKLKYKVDPQVFKQMDDRPAGDASKKRKPGRNGKAGQAQPKADPAAPPSAEQAPAAEPRRADGSQDLVEILADYLKDRPETLSAAGDSAEPADAVIAVMSPTAEGSGSARETRAGTKADLSQRRRQRREALALRRAQMFVVGSFLGVLAVFGVCSLVLTKPTVSEYERRELAAMPKFTAHDLFWGDYLRDVEAHYADTFPLRDTFVQASARLGELRGLRVDGVRLIGAASPNQSGTAMDTSPPESTAPQRDTAVLSAEYEEETPFEMVDDGALGEQTENGLFIYHGRAMNIYGGNAEMGSLYAATLNSYAEKFGSGVQVYDIVVPTSVEFYLPDRCKSVTNPQKPQIDHIYGELKNVKGVDAYTSIHNHAGEYLYFNTDHHWTGLGAYYAYTAFCETAGLKPLALDEYEKQTLDNTFLGTFYSQSYDTQLKNSADTVEYYIVPGDYTVTRYDKGAPNTARDHSIWADYASGPNSYGVFLHGDYPLIHVRSQSNKNGRKAVVIKESFGNAFAPFLVAHYEDLYIVDQRHFEKGLVSFVAEEKIDDVIFINNAFAANTKVRIDDIIKLMY